MFSELTPPPSHNQIGIIVFLNICGCQNVLGQIYVVFVWYKQIFSIYWVVHTCIYCFRIVFKLQYMSRQVSPHCGNWTTFTMNIYWMFFRNRILFPFLRLTLRRLVSGVTTATSLEGLLQSLKFLFVWLKYFNLNWIV